MDNGATERTITAPTLNKLLDKIEALTPEGMVAVTTLMGKVGENWQVKIRFKKSINEGRARKEKGANN